MSSGKTSRRIAQGADQPAGSPIPGEPAFLVVGKLRRPHGLHGEIIMDIYTDFPERLKSGVRVYLGEEHQPFLIRSRRIHGNCLLLAFDTLDSPELAGEFRNQMVYVRTDDRPALSPGEYYQHQLLGLDVFSDAGQALGKVVEILETGANDVLVVRPELGRDILLPLIDAVVLEIDLPAGLMRVHLMDGLLSE